LSAITSSTEWRKFKPYIERALPDDLYEISDIERGLEEGQYTFWPGRTTAAVTEFSLYPNGKALNIFAAGGEVGPGMNELTGDMRRCLEAWGRAADCRWILGYGRPGWERVGKALGFRHLWSVLAKELS
jgi:hypothetical protein